MTLEQTVDTEAPVAPPEPEEPAGPVTLQLAACEVCDAVFMGSGRRETSPCHGADPIAIIATVVINPEGQAVGIWGAGAPAAAVAADVRPDTVAGPIAEAPLAEKPSAEEVLRSPAEVFVYATGVYLANGDVSEEDLRIVLEEGLGTKPRTANMTVQRLRAVRDMLRGLVEANVEAQVEVAVEETPAEPAEPPSVE